MLAASIGADSTYAQLLDKKSNEELCHNLNYRHKMAQYAGRASVALNTHLFFRGKVQHEDGYAIVNNRCFFLHKILISISIFQLYFICTQECFTSAYTEIRLRRYCIFKFLKRRCQEIAFKCNFYIQRRGVCVDINYIILHLK